MAEESWHEAQLIPTSGISGAEEQERRATSALLAVLTAVRKFGQAITQPLGPQEMCTSSRSRSCWARSKFSPTV